MAWGRGSNCCENFKRRENMKKERNYSEKELEVIDVDKDIRARKVIVISIMIVLLLAIIILVYLRFSYYNSSNQGVAKIILDSVSFDNPQNPSSVTVKLKNIGEGIDGKIAIEIENEGKVSYLNENLPLRKDETATYGFPIKSTEVRIKLNGQQVYP